MAYRVRIIKLVNRSDSSTRILLHASFPEWNQEIHVGFDTLQGDEALILGNLFISEPSGRTAPKTTGDGLNKYRGVEGESLALACAAQGFPAPITRYTSL